MRVRLMTMLVAAAAVAAPGELFAQGLCASLVAGVKAGADGFRSSGVVPMPRLTDCRIREHSDRPQQRQLICSVAYEERGCSATVKALYQQLLPEVQSCAAAHWPQARADASEYTDVSDGDGQTTRLRNVAPSADGYHLDVEVGWSVERYRSGRTDCSATVAIRMR